MQADRTNETRMNDLSLLTEVFEQAPAFMAVLSGRDHVFEMVNRAYSQLVGHREIIGKPVRVALPEVAGQGFIELLNEVLQTGAPFTGTEMKVLLQLTPDGPLEERYLNFVYQARRNTTGEIVGVFVHGVDVTELVVSRQKSEEHARQLKQQAHTFDVMLSHITDFVYLFDLDGCFTYSNKPLLDLLGISLEDIIGKSFYDLPYPEELAQTLQAHIQHVIDTKQQIVDETLYVSPSGVVGYYEYIFSPVLGADGQVAVVAGSTRNITDRVRQQRQKDEFLAIASHELKTPLTSLKAYGQVLQRQLARDGKVSAVAHLAKMDAQINRLIALINDLLDVTMLEGGTFQYHDADFAFDTLIAETIEEVQRTTERQTISREGLTNATVYGDRARIGQVLINLLTNAIKYAPEAERIVVRSTADGETVTVRVQDFGMGISPERQIHVFERFYRALETQYETVPGLGLGLYVSAEIIQRHGGRIWVESEQGKGATFCFSLPLQLPQTAANAV